MKLATVHYIYDPLCGWCYGVAPLAQAARELIDVCAHGGGMMAGADVRTGADDSCSAGVCIP